MERILAILSEEKEYSRELAAYLANRRDFIFRPLVFTDTETYSDYVRSHKVDMLVCDEEIIESLDNDTVADNICVLSQHGLVAEEQQYPGIFKYQSSEAVMKEIIKFYTKKENLKQFGEIQKDKAVSPQIISVCSPVGGSYKSTFAFSLAKYHSCGGKVLFMTFDPFFSFPGEIKSPSDRNLTDILYYLQNSSCDPVSFVEKLSKKLGNLEYIEGAAHWFDVAEMKPNHIGRFLESVSINTHYDTVVMEISADSVAGVEILMCSDRIYTPVTADLGAHKKIEEWKRQIEFIGRQEILEKIIELQIPFDELLDGECGIDQMLKGRVGKFLEELEGRHYFR